MFSMGLDKILKIISKIYFFKSYPGFNTLGIKQIYIIQLKFPKYEQNIHKNIKVEASFQ